MPKGVYERTPEMIAARIGRKASDKTRKKISDSKKGVPLSPEHCAAISKGHKNSDAVKAKDEAQRGVPRTPEACAAMSVARKGIPKTMEHIAAIKKGLEESGVYDRMRGGNDIVNHHFIYDHSDLSLNTVRMIRKDHSRLHRLLKKLGYVVPHINKGEIT